jgi:hypothetical protein
MGCANSCGVGRVGAGVWLGFLVLQAGRTNCDRSLDSRRN